ncbi:transmembrane protein, putative (macronuclear) [Tetrahymena thermophila SB210]|uniref:Transmembrane protein, putative n=1 Tax=Tetrahymena thermophila (strain SB210) TaxID=312017 RepID=Q22MX1_TETTS|nr:transmembrane protein, putative [Tetrahymena thermophila SB210]EAR86488.2 transmembrane protein, putative [Tetrahymena thermophila SB210]|eukprot:XP_976899.2 transmembrane protein, putative [Tetrahymena thermophila SB210]
MSLCYECPRVYKYLSNTANSIYQDVIPIDGTNMILAQSQSLQQQSMVQFGLFEMSTNSCIQLITTLTSTQQVIFSQSLNQLFSYQGFLNIINMQTFNVQNFYTLDITNIAAIQKSSLDDSQAILVTYNFISYYFSLSTGQIIGKQFSTSTSSTVNSFMSHDHQLKDYKLLSQVGIGRIDLYDLATGNLITSKIKGDSLQIACIVEIPNSNYLLVSYGTSQLYLWQIQQNVDQSITLQEILSLNLIRYIPLKMNNFIGYDGQTYIGLFTGQAQIKQNIQYSYRDIYLLQFISNTSTIQIIEAYPFYTYQNQNNFNNNQQPSQISLNDNNYILQASTFISSSQRAYGFSFDTHLLFPFLENKLSNQCDFDLDGSIDNYCRIPIIINKSNTEIAQAYYILNDGNILVADNNQIGFRIYQSANLLTKQTLIPDRFYERCLNCVQRIRSISPNQNSSSNVKAVNQDEQFVFPKRFDITGMGSAFVSSWLTNQGAYIYDYVHNNLISVDLSQPMSNPSQKIYLSWSLTISYNYNNLLYYCLSYNIPAQQYIQKGYFNQDLITNLQQYFTQHNIECYTINQQFQFQNLFLLKQQQQFNYQTAIQQQFKQICDVSQSTTELICINGQSQLNIWSLDTLQYKRQTIISSCQATSQLILYLNHNIPYVIINCKNQLVIVDSTNLQNSFSILQSMNVQNVLVQQQILFALINQNSQAVIQFYNFTHILLNSKDSPILGQFYDSTSTSALIGMDYQVSTQTLYMANQETQYALSSIDPQFYFNNISSCDFNIYYSFNPQNNLFQQKQQLILQNNIGYPLAYGIGSQISPYSNQAQILEGLYFVQNFIQMIDLSLRKSNFMANINLNIDNSKQNPLIKQFFSWNIQTACLIITPLQTIPNKPSVVIVYEETINILSWKFLQINNIQFLIDQYSTIQNFVSLNIESANQVNINSIFLHLIPQGQNIISKNLITTQSCQQVTITNYQIDSQNITSTSPLFSISNSQNALISNISISNSFIENSVIFNSVFNLNSQIINNLILNNTFCSYAHYQNYLQQQSSLNNAYQGFTFTHNFNIQNLNISSNSFCYNTNFISGQSEDQMILINNINNNSLIQINQLYFMNNKFINGLILQNILYEYTLNQQNQYQLIVQANFQAIQIQNNQLQNISVPPSWSGNIQSQNNSKQLQYVQERQTIQCSYIQVNYIQQFQLTQSSILNEVLCGFVSLTQIYNINLNNLNFINTNKSISALNRTNSLIYIQESSQISISKVSLINTNFLNCIAIYLDLVEFNTQTINISNNTFQNINLTSSLYYIQVNTIYISNGQSNSNIILNDNTFSQIIVAFSTSSQTLSSSCIASQSLVSNITMSRNTFNDTYSNSINGALILNGIIVAISSSIFSNNIYSNINLQTLSSDIQVNGGFLKTKTSFLNITNTTFTDCVTQYGAVYITPSDMNLNITFMNTNFINLVSFSSGSAIYLQGSQSQLNLNIQSSYFSNLYSFYSQNYKGSIKAAIQIDANQNNNQYNNQIQLSNLTLENISGVSDLQVPSYFFSVGQSIILANGIKVKRFIQNVTSYIVLFKALQIYSIVQIYSSIFNIFSNSICTLYNINIEEPRVNDLTHTLQEASIIHPVLISLVSQSSFFGQNITLTDLNINAQGGIMYIQDAPQYELANFTANNSNQIYDSSLNVNIGLPFQNIWNSLLNFQNVQNITIAKGAVFCSDTLQAETNKTLSNMCQGRILQAFQSQITISDSIFKNYGYQIGNGTGLSLVNMKGINTIKNVLFQNLISSQTGGALFVYSNFNTQINNNMNLVINNATFQNNSAQDFGGAIAFENSPTNNAIQSIKLNITNSVFQHNSAKIAACIFYNNFMPSIQNQSNYFIDNIAQMGNIIFSQPRAIKLIPYPDLQNSLLSNSPQYKNYLRTNNTRLQLLHASGQEIPTLMFKLYYYDSITESVESEKEVILSLLDVNKLFSQTQVNIQQYPQQLDSTTDLNNTYILLGSTNIFYNQTGNYLYIDLNLWSIPESDFDLIFNFSMIKIPNYQNNIIQQSYQYIAQVYNRNCTSFETISQPYNMPSVGLSQSVIQCNKCPNLTFAYNQQICQECPMGATCKQDQNIIVQEGYWRRQFDTYTILSCDNNFQSCIGGDSVGNNLCKEGYIGALCQECDLFSDYWSDNYAKQGQYSCVKCNQMILSYIFLVLLIIFTVILAVVSMHSNAIFIYKRVAQSILWKFRKRQSLKKGEDQDQFENEFLTRYAQNSNSQSSYFKIIASYLQILGSLSNFNISIPSFFPQVLNSFGNPIKVSIESMDCLLKNYSRTWIGIIRHKLNELYTNWRLIIYSIKFK